MPVAGAPSNGVVVLHDVGTCVTTGATPGDRMLNGTLGPNGAASLAGQDRTALVEYLRGL